MNVGIEANSLAPKPDVGQRTAQDGECFRTQVDAAKQWHLDQLQIALIAGREFANDAEDFEQAGLGAGTTATDQLEYVWITLLRHDGGARGKRLGQLYVGELLRVEQQQIGGQASHVLHHQRDLEQQLRLGLAARQLYRRHRLVHFRKTEAACRVLAIQRKIAAHSSTELGIACCMCV